MLPAFYTFQDLIKFNSGNWDQAYEVLNYFLDQGKLIKEIRGPEDIIYHNQGNLPPFKLAYDWVFLSEQEKNKKRRPRIRKIAPDNGDLFSNK